MIKKNIIVFGGNGLVGGQIVRSYILKKKFNFIIVDLKSKKKLKNFYNHNLNNFDRLGNLLKKIEKKHGKIHGAINCVYPKRFQKKRLMEVNTRLFCEEIAYHLGIYFNINKILSAYFIKKKTRGTIINFSSIYGEFLPRFEVYSKTNMTMPVQYMVVKNCINSMIKYFSKYLLKKNINFFTISPGGIFDKQNTKFLENYNKHCNKGMLNPQDLNGLIEFLLSEKSLKMRGNNFVIDDGYTL